MPSRVADLIEQLTVQPGPIARLEGRAQQRWESLLQLIEQTGEVEAAPALSTF